MTLSSKLDWRRTQVKGGHVRTSGEAEFPELMAKASVIYNPIVYAIINERFRYTLWVIISGNVVHVGADESSVSGLDK